MKAWTEFHIGLVYYSALLIAFIAGILSLLYLRPNKNILLKIVEKTGVLWSRSFVLTLTMAGILGAMSVSFTDCNTNYHKYLGQPQATIQVGLGQVSAGCSLIAFITRVWFFIFVTLRLSSAWRIKAGLLIRILIAFGVIFCAIEFYESLKNGFWLHLLNPFNWF